MGSGTSLGSPASFLGVGELGSSAARERIRVQELKSSGPMDRGREGSRGAWLCTSSRLLGSPIHWAMNGLYPHSLEADHVHAHYGTGGFDKKEPGCGKSKRGQRLTPFSRPQFHPILHMPGGNTLTPTTLFCIPKSRRVEETSCHSPHHLAGNPQNPPLGFCQESTASGGEWVQGKDERDRRGQAWSAAISRGQSPPNRVEAPQCI